MESDEYTTIAERRDGGRAGQPRRAAGRLALCHLGQCRLAQRVDRHALHRTALWRHSRHRPFDGRNAWDEPVGTARRNGPWGIPSMLPIKIGMPNNGGLVVTASGLIFIAAATDNLFRAIDIETGETLWTDVLPAGGQANPIAYEVDGKQYVMVTAMVTTLWKPG